MEKRPLLWIAGGFVLGEGMGLRCITTRWLLPIAAGVVCFGFRKQEYSTIQKRSRGSLMCGLVLFFMLVGFWRGEHAREVWTEEQNLGWQGEERSYTGKITELSERDTMWEMILDAQDQDAQDQNVWEQKQPERLLVYADRKKTEGQDFHIGGIVRVQGKSELFEKARNPGQFDYRKYYRSRKLSYRMRADSCTVVEKSGLWWDRWREAQRTCSTQMGEVLDRICEPEAAGIFRAVLLGDRSRLEPEVRERYQRTGIAHLLSISAIHLSMIHMAVYGGLRKVGFEFGGAGVGGALFLLNYALMTGMSVSVSRALFMAVLGYLAAYLGKTDDLLTSLAVSSLYILWNSPYLLTQPGMQLSYGAVFGIAAAAPVFRRRGMDAGMAAAVGMQLTTLPVLLFHFYQIPLYSILINVLAVPLMGVVLGSGIAGVLIGMRSLAAGRFAIGAGHAVLWFYDILCRFSDTLPGSNLILGQPEMWKIVLYYGSYVGLLIWLGRKAVSGKSAVCRKWLICGGFGLMLFLMIPLPKRGMEAVFLDVGQGDGICLRTRSSTVLVDGGSSSEADVGKECLEPFLKSRGIRRVDYAVVSHADADHTSGLEYILKEAQGIRIGCLVLPAAGRGDEVYERLVRLSDRHGSRIIWMKKGVVLEEGELRMTCLYPEGSPSLTGKDRNEHSLVLRVDYREFHMLLTGDMTARGERELLENREVPEQIQVIKIAHHGSDSASSEAWLKAVSPSWAVLSYGNGNQYGHPHQEVTDRLNRLGIQTWHTGKQGAVWMETDGERIVWRTFLH